MNSNGVVPCPFEGCSRSFHDAMSLNKHIELIHSESNQFECESCHKALSSLQNLKEHTYTHTGERPYVCDFPNCQRSFRQRSLLSAHKKAHRVSLQRLPVEFVELKVTFK